MRLSVIIPTYKRVKDLAKCLNGVISQDHSPDEVILIVREDDPETGSFLRSGKLPENVLIRSIRGGGQVQAMNRGIDVSTGDILVFIDDDAVPHQGWLSRIVERYKNDALLGGVGGKDNLFLDGVKDESMAAAVGKITWYGRIIGNHHAGYGDARMVDHLKGTNMSFRKKALDDIRCDSRLKGRGAQYRNDLALCLAVRNGGWKLLYDPSIAVDHYYSVRFDSDIRGRFDSGACMDLAFNNFFVILRYMRGWERISCVIYSLLVSDIATPGVLQVIRMIVLKKGDFPRQRFFFGMKGRIRALRPE